MLSDESSLFFDVDEFEQIGEFYLDNSSFEKVIVLCEYALLIYPDNLNIILLKGHALLGVGKISEAKELLIRYKDKFGGNVDIYLLLAAVCSRLKEHQKAIEYYLLILKEADKVLRLEVSFDLVYEYQLVNDYSSAIDLLEEMIAIHFDNESVQFELAYCLDYEQKNDEAVLLFTSFTDDHPYSYTGWFNLGNFLLKVDRLDDALEAFELSCAIKIDYVPSMINCGMIYMINEDYQKAIQCFNDVVKIENDNDFVFCALAEAYEMTDSFSKAIACYEKAVEVNSSSVEGLFGLAYLYHSNAEYKKAFSYIVQARKKDELNESVLLLFVQIKLELADSFEVEDALVDFLSIKPDSLNVSLELADYYYYNMNDIILAFEVLDDGIYGEIDEKHILVIRKVTYLHSEGQKQSAYNELHFLLSFFDDKKFIADEILAVSPEMMMDEVIIRLLS